MSHLAKHGRGLVARHLLETGADPATPAALAETLARGWRVRPAGAVRSGPAVDRRDVERI